MLLLMIAGIAAILAGAAAIWVGIPIKEFSFGNTMILAGAVGVCSGFVLIGLGIVVRELKAIRARLQDSVAEARRESIDGPPLPAGSIAGRGAPSEADRIAPPPLTPPPRRAEDRHRGSGTREREDAAAAPGDEPDTTATAETESAPRPARRNLLFSSSRRQGRDQTGAPEVAAGEAASEPQVEPHPSFRDAWPRNGRGARDESATARRDSSADRIAPPSREPQAAATVVKSGTVDGMAYSLYSDGSIEAQMREGMMRFASIEQLRAHLDRTT